MPMSNRQSIGFYDKGVDRLKELCEITETTQRDLIAAFIAQPNDRVKEIVNQWRVSHVNVRKRRSELASILKSKKLSKEQLERISKIIESDED